MIRLSQYTYPLFERLAFNFDLAKVNSAVVNELEGNLRQALMLDFVDTVLFLNDIQMLEPIFGEDRAKMFYTVTKELLNDPDYTSFYKQVAEEWLRRYQATHKIQDQPIYAEPMWNKAIQKIRQHFSCPNEIRFMKDIDVFIGITHLEPQPPKWRQAYV